MNCKKWNDIKALSLWSPFPQLIMLNIKKIENRNEFQLRHKFGSVINSHPKKYMCRWCLENKWNEKCTCEEYNQRMCKSSKSSKMCKK